MNDRPQPQTPNGKRKLAIIAVVIILAFVGFIYWLTGRGKVSTDDAQINGDLVPISSRVAGYVAAIAVSENQQVRAGRLLVQLDTRDLETRSSRAQADLANQTAQAASAAAQLALTQRTAPSAAGQAGAGVSIAQSGVDVAAKQVAAAQAQYEAARAGVETAQAVVAAARSDVDAAAAQVESAQAAARAAEADVTSAAAQAKKTSADLARMKQLHAQGAISQQQLDAVEAANTSAQSALDASRDRANAAKAAVAQAKARQAGANAGLKQTSARLSSAEAAARQARTGVGAARAALAQAYGQVTRAQAQESGANTVPQQLAVARAQRRSADARMKLSAAELNAARLQLSYTKIVAPVAGIISQKSIQLGQYVQPGQLLMAVVPTSKVWVVANFKETQIGRMRPGQRAEIEIDSHPGRTFRGKINSIGAATQAKFSLLPSENATGNFVKVVQRIPVKIYFDEPIPEGMVLRPGQNVTATVRL